jgi:hypothetical protein
VIEAYNAPFPTPESKAGVLAFPELVPTEIDHPTTSKMLEVRAALESWDRPALVLFSDSDPIFSTVAAEHMASRIPGAGRPSSSRARATSCKRRRARRSPRGSCGSWQRPRRADVRRAASGNDPGVAGVEQSGEVALASLLAGRLQLLAHELVVDGLLEARKTPSGTAPSVSQVIRESAKARLACT